MLRFLSIALPLLIVLLAVFGVVVGALDLEPRTGAVIRLALFDQPQVAAPVVLGAWLMEACGLMALFLLAQGRCGSWWLDGLVAGWVGWVFRGPLLVLTVVVATRQPQDPWWRLAVAWWVLYSLSGLVLGWLGRAVEPAPEATDLAVEMLDVQVLDVQALPVDGTPVEDDASQSETTKEEAVEEAGEKAEEEVLEEPVQETGDAPGVMQSPQA